MARDSTRRLGRRRAPSRRAAAVAVEQLLAAEDHRRRPRPGGSRPGRGPVTRRSRSRLRRACPAVSTSPRRWHSASFWQAISTRSRAADGVQFVAHPADVAAEPLDRLDAQVDSSPRPTAAAGPTPSPRQLSRCGERALRREQPVGSATRSRKCLPCSLRSSGSTRTTHVPAAGSRRPTPRRGLAPARPRRGPSTTTLFEFAEAAAASPARTGGSTRPRRRRTRGGTALRRRAGTRRGCRRGGRTRPGTRPPRRACSRARRARPGTPSGSSASPTRIRRPRASRSAGGGTGCMRAAMVVRTSRGGSAASRRRTRSRRPAVSSKAVRPGGQSSKAGRTSGSILAKPARSAAHGSRSAG